MESGQFDLSAVRALRQQADELAGALSAGAAATRAEFIGVDEAGVVEVTTDVSGVPARVRLARDWHRSVGVSGLGPAVLTALSAAVTQRLAAWAQGVAGGGETPPADRDGRGATESAVARSDPGAQTDSTGPSGSAGPSDSTGRSDPAGRIGTGGHVEAGDPSSRQAVHGLRNLMDLIADVTDRLGELTRLAATAAEAPVTSTNAGRTVRVTAVAGTITAIEFDERWLRSTEHGRAAEAIQEALAAATLATAKARQDLLDSVPGLDRVRRLTASPETLFREIGLLG